MGKGQETRERLMDIAEEAILAKGFTATSIEEIISEADITKSGFFYHFPDKNVLAQALLKRYRDREDALFDDLFGRARELHDDPLHALLIGLKMLSELLEDLPNGHPGCLVATFCYNDRLYVKEIHELNRELMLGWRARFRAMFEEIAERYPPREDVDFDVLADMVSSTVEGGIVMSKALGDAKVLPQQVMMLRRFVKYQFLPGNF